MKNVTHKIIIKSCFILILCSSSILISAQDCESTLIENNKTPLLNKSPETILTYEKCLNTFFTDYKSMLSELETVTEEIEVDENNLKPKIQDSIKMAKEIEQLTTASDSSTPISSNEVEKKKAKFKKLKDEISKMEIELASKNKMKQQLETDSKNSKTLLINSCEMIISYYDDTNDEAKVNEYKKIQNSLQ